MCSFQSKSFTFPDTGCEYHNGVADSGDKVEESGDGLGDQPSSRPAIVPKGLLRLLDDPEGAGVSRRTSQRLRDCKGCVQAGWCRWVFVYDGWLIIIACKAVQLCLSVQKYVHLFVCLDRKWSLHAIIGRFFIPLKMKVCLHQSVKMFVSFADRIFQDVVFCLWNRST